MDYTIKTNQEHIHTKLEDILNRYKYSKYQRPIAEHSKQAFLSIHEEIINHPKPILLDSGCGTGLSSYQLAKTHPNHWIIAIDKSTYRLKKAVAMVATLQQVSTANQQPLFPLPQKQAEQMAYHAFPNLRFIRAECIDFWRLCLAYKWHVEKHYLFYPNPWPLAEHIKRRWHGHPVFSDLLCLTNNIEIRSNWLLYLQEFQFAAQIIRSDLHYHIKSYKINCAEEAMTLFEKKYYENNVPLYQLALR